MFNTVGEALKKTRFFKRNIESVFLMLGNECNLNCRYCLQHPLIDHKISHDINPDIYDFLEEVACGSADIINIQFFGGEPLLFKDNIKTIIKEVTRRKIPTTWSVLTNGKAIDKEYVELFKEHNFGVGISWDGYNTVKTRGYDPFAHNKELLFQLPKLGVSAVMSTENYPKDICAAFQELSNEYKEIWGYHLMMNVDEIYDTGGIPEDLLAFNYEKLFYEIQDLARCYFNEKYKGEEKEEHHAVYCYIADRYMKLRSFFMQDNPDYNKTTCRCCNGYNVYNLGIDGTMYPCHNTSKNCGSIYDPYNVYLEKVLKQDPTQLMYENLCKGCSALGYCMCGCKLMSKEQREQHYCRLMRTITEAITSVIQESVSSEGDNHG